MFIFIRHPQALHNIGYKLSDTFRASVDEDLTPTGFKQAEELAEIFKNWLEESGKKVTRVICSPFIRPIRAADQVLKAIDYKGTVELDPIFRERCNGSPCNLGREKSELLRYLRANTDLLEHWVLDTSAMTEEVWFDTDVESIPDIVERARKIARDYIEPANDSDDEITLVFSHGGIGMALTGAKMIYNCEVLDVTGFHQAETLMVPEYGYDEYNELYKAHKERREAQKAAGEEEVHPGLEITLIDPDNQENSELYSEKPELNTTPPTQPPQSGERPLPPNGP